MQSTTILYEPLPIGRIGVHSESKEVVLASDFSTFAYMLEEFIGLAVTNIAILKSAPEIKSLDQMPPLLRKRVKEIDDDNEKETVERLLYPLRTEYGIKIHCETGRLEFPKGLSEQLKSLINYVHGDLKRLSLGFNHNIQVGINAKTSVHKLRELRKNVKDSNSRFILSQIEALFNQYEDVRFDIPTPCNKSPKELIAIFDRLVNDDNYLDLSYSVSQLSEPSLRSKALVKLRDIGRLMVSKSYISTGWDYASKVIKVWSGVSIPEAKKITSLFVDKSLPPLIDLTQARNRAVDMWLASSESYMPLGRDGEPIAGDQIIWLPPLKSVKASHPDDLKVSIGVTSELLALLQETEINIDLIKKAATPKTHNKKVHGRKKSL